VHLTPLLRGSPWKFVIVLGAQKNYNDAPIRQSKTVTNVHSFTNSTGIGWTERRIFVNNIALSMHCMLMQNFKKILHGIPPPRNKQLPFPSGLQANAETTVPSDGGVRVQTFCHCDNRCRTTCMKEHTQKGPCWICWCIRISTHYLKQFTKPYQTICVAWKVVDHNISLQLVTYIFWNLKAQLIPCSFFDCPLLALLGFFRNTLNLWIQRGKYMYLSICAANWCDFWHFIPIFINLFIRWCHQLWASLRNWSCFDLCFITLTFQPLNGVTGLLYHWPLSCQFSACYALPFSI